VNCTLQASSAFADISILTVLKSCGLEKFADVFEEYGLNFVSDLKEVQFCPCPICSPHFLHNSLI
jgi:hypothetical protein